MNQLAVFLNNNLVDILLGLSATLLAAVAFADEIGKKRKLGFVKHLGFKITVIIFAVILGGVATKMKDDKSKSESEIKQLQADNLANSNRERLALIEESNRKQLSDLAQKNQLELRVVTETNQQKLEKKNNEIQRLQQDQIIEFKGAGFPVFTATLFHETLEFNLHNPEQLPVYSVSARYWDENLADKWTYDTVTTSRFSANQELASCHKNFLLLSLGPISRINLYNDNIRGYSQKVLKYNIDISWRGGSYSVEVALTRQKSLFEMTSVTIYYKDKAYTEKEFFDEFHQNIKNDVLEQVQLNDFREFNSTPKRTSYSY